MSQRSLNAVHGDERADDVAGDIWIPATVSGQSLPLSAMALVERLLISCVRHSMLANKAGIFLALFSGDSQCVDGGIHSHAEVFHQILNSNDHAVSRCPLLANHDALLQTLLLLQAQTLGLIIFRLKHTSHLRTSSRMHSSTARLIASSRDIPSFLCRLILSTRMA